MRDHVSLQVVASFVALFLTRYFFLVLIEKKKLGKKGAHKS